MTCYVQCFCHASIVYVLHYQFFEVTGFDLTTRDSYFTILDEVFTNYILAENTYFMKHLG